MLSVLPASLSSTGVELEQELLLDEKESTFGLGESWGGAPSSPGMILFLIVLSLLSLFPLIKTQMGLHVAYQLYLLWCPVFVQPAEVAPDLLLWAGKTLFGDC